MLWTKFRTTCNLSCWCSQIGVLYIGCFNLESIQGGVRKCNSDYLSWYNSGISAFNRVIAGDLLSRRSRTGLCSTLPRSTGSRRDKLCFPTTGESAWLSSSKAETLSDVSSAAIRCKKWAEKLALTQCKFAEDFKSMLPLPCWKKGNAFQDWDLWFSGFDNGLLLVGEEDGCVLIAATRRFSSDISCLSAAISLFPSALEAVDWLFFFFLRSCRRFLCALLNLLYSVLE